MYSSKLSYTINKLEEEFRKYEIKKKYNLFVLSPTLGKARYCTTINNNNNNKNKNKSKNNNNKENQQS